MIYLIFILILTIFLGLELITKVPATLHTPLMSGSNAISGITLVGALTLLDRFKSNSVLVIVLSVMAIAFATVNVVGGYMVTDRMLAMFKAKKVKK